MKKCVKCNETKSLDLFYNHKHSADGKHSYCKPCSNESKNKRRQANPEHYRAWNRQAKKSSYERTQVRFKRHGITEDVYRQMLVAQNNTCPICKESFEVVRPNIDHCHDTQEVRGILCWGCNIGIGQFKDDIERLQNAIIYLGKYDRK